MNYDTVNHILWPYDKPWCDFVSYCPDFPFNKQLYTYRVYRYRDKEDQMVDRLNEFVSLVDKYTEILEL